MGPHKNNKNKKKIILTSIILILIILPAYLPNVSAGSQILLHMGTGSTEIKFVHKKGDSDIKWIYDSHLSVDAPSIIPTGTYSVKINSFTGLSNLYSVTNGTLMDSGATNNFLTVDIGTSICAQSSATSMDFETAFQYSGLLYNTSSDNQRYVDTVVDCSTIVAGESSDDYSSITDFYSGLDANLSYHLEPSLIINSEYYNFNNIRIEEKDKANGNWNEQDPNNLILLHPEYKLRLYDLESNQIIFEDLSYQMFKYQRTITIHSTKLTNNSDKLISFNLITDEQEYSDQKATSAYSEGATTNDYTYTWYDKSGYYRSYGATDHINCKIYFANAEKYLTSVTITSYANAGKDFQIYFTDGSHTDTFYILDGGSKNFDFKEFMNKTVDYIYFFGSTSSSSYYIEISSIHFYNAVETDVNVNPYSSVIVSDVIDYYNIYDLYSNLLHTGSITNETVISYTPAILEECNLMLTDNSSEHKILSFDNYRVYIDDSLITSTQFQAERNSQINVSINNLQDEKIRDYIYDVTPGTNYITVPINVLYLQNNANEPINISGIQNGHYQGAESFDLDEVNVAPEGWTDYADNGCLNYISNKVGNHSKVLTLDDQNSAGICDDNYEILSQTSGSVEFYIYSSNTILQTAFFLKDGATYHKSLTLVLKSGKLIYNDGSEHDITTGLEDNIWYHIRIVFDCATTWSVYLDGMLKGDGYGYFGTPVSMNNFSISTQLNANGYQSYIDALDFSWSDGYYEGRNLELNTSANLWNWNAFPNWESGNYQCSEDWGTADNPDLSDWNDVSGPNCTVSIVDGIGGHNAVMKMYDNDAVNKADINKQFSDQGYGSVAFYFRTEEVGNYFAIAVGDTSLSTGSAHFMFRYNEFKFYNGTYNTITSAQSNTWYRCVIDFRTTGAPDYKGLSENRWQVTIGEILYGEYEFRGTVSNINRIDIETYTVNFGYASYIDALWLSWDGSVADSNLLENTTFAPLPMALNFTKQINPYSQAILNYSTSNYLVGISDLYSNLLNVQSLTNDTNDNELVYTPANIKTCFISLSDQRSNYLDWENYHLYLNNTALYDNTFTRELNSYWNISIYDHFNQFLTSQVYQVQRDSNFIDIELTLWSLKIYNQQEKFIHSNITNSNNFWSEWLAPGESTEYRLRSGNYDVNISEYETGTDSIYSYTLAGDDYLLISSQNSILNVLNNIENVNSTIGNQITNVNVSISNDMSTISNQTVNIQILLNNTNTTLTDLIVNQNLVLDVINSSINNLNVSQSALINAVNSSIMNVLLEQSSFLNLMNSSIHQILINQSISLDAISSDIYTYYVNQINSLNAINSSIAQQIIEQGIFIALMNSTLNDLIISNFLGIESVNSTIVNMLIDQGLLLNLIGSNITNATLQQILALQSVNSTILQALLQQNTWLDGNFTTLLLQQNTILNITNDINTLLIDQGITIESMNSTIVNMLIEQSQDINIINGSINALLYFTNQSFISLNNNISLSVIQLNNSISFINTQLSAVQTSIANQIYILNTSISYMQNNISTEINSMQDNITGQFNQLSQNVYLINGSIYSYIATLDQSLNISNTQIMGNQEIMISMNQYLTQLYQKTLFSEFLNWTGTAYNQTYIDEQIQQVKFTNLWQNQSVMLLLKYNDQIKQYQINMQKDFEQFMPKEGVTYAVNSLNGTLLEDWQEVKNKSISFGMFEETYVPSELTVNGVSSADFIIAFIIIIAASIMVFLTMKAFKGINIDKITKKKFTPKKYSTGRSNPVSTMRRRKN